MKKRIQDLTAMEYLEAIRRVRSNPPEMTEGEFWQQFREMETAREQQSQPGKAERSGDGLKRTTVA
jgi:hypothetical protein